MAPPLATGRAAATDPLHDELVGCLVAVHRPKPVALDLLVEGDDELPRPQLPTGHWTLQLGDGWATAVHIPGVPLLYGRVLHPELDTADLRQVFPVHAGEALVPFRLVALRFGGRDWGPAAFDRHDRLRPEAEAEQDGLDRCNALASMLLPINPC